MQTENESLLTDEYRDYLEALRESGVTNMWGAPSYLEKSFDLTWKDACQIFSEWKKEKETKTDGQK